MNNYNKLEKIKLKYQMFEVYIQCHISKNFSRSNLENLKKKFLKDHKLNQINIKNAQFNYQKKIYVLNAHTLKNKIEIIIEYIDLKIQFQNRK